MTTIYFIRHAEPNYNNHKDETRELSVKGLEDRKLVSEYLSNKNIDIVLSSPYKRAIDTVKHFAEIHHLPIEIMEDFRERKVDNGWIDNFNTFCKQQWDDFSYRLADGESLSEVQSRNISALKSVIEKYKDKIIVVGSHGTALSTIINYFDPAFGYHEFINIQTLMPWIVKFVFCDDTIQEIEKINPFTLNIFT